MGSLNFNWFPQNWFQSPPNPIPLTPFFKLTPQSTLPFALISKPTFFTKKSPQTSNDPLEPGRYERMLHQYFQESINLPDHRHTDAVERILKRDEEMKDVFERKEDVSQEEIEKNVEWWEGFKENPVVQFMKRVEDLQDWVNEKELKENARPYRKEDRRLWKALPHVEGLDGRPLVRKSVKNKKESDDKFWDFMKEFLFGLWGFKQRPYPSGRPIDVSQAIGYERLEKRYYDFIMRGPGFYYKDRLGRTRGPLEIIQLKTAWGGGIIDKDTFIWGDDMDEWAPIHMVYGMERAIATWEVRLSAAAVATLHKLMNGIPPWVPAKGHEKKTYKQLQEEAVESKKRDLAVMEANDGIWPGVRIPSHALFLWASGTELTTILEKDHMPNKFIPKDVRIQLAKAIPGLRPWEVLSVEQAMDRMTYGGKWYRPPLGSYTTGPPYLRSWKQDVLRYYKVFRAMRRDLRNILFDGIPGFEAVLERLGQYKSKREARKKALVEAKKRKEDEKYYNGSNPVDEDQ